MSTIAATFSRRSKQQHGRDRARHGRAVGAGGRDRRVPPLVGDDDVCAVRGAAVARVQGTVQQQSAAAALVRMQSRACDVVMCLGSDAAKRMQSIW